MSDTSGYTAESFTAVNAAQLAKQTEAAARLHEAQQAAMQAESEKRKTYIPSDLMMPEGVDELIVGDGVAEYDRIRKTQAKLDSLLLRKRLALQDPLQNRIDKYSTLKVWISNTVDGQPWQGTGLDENTFDFGMPDDATFKVKIMGRVIDDAEDASKDRPAESDSMEVDEKDADTSPPKKRVKFSHLFKAITVDFDRNKNLQPDGLTQIEWKKPKPPAQGPNAGSNAPLPAEADFDQLEFERKADENINCTISLYRDDLPERYQLSKELADLLDTEELDYAGIVSGIWEYGKLMDLQFEDNKQHFKCDARMYAVSVPGSHIMERRKHS